MLISKKMLVMAFCALLLLPMNFAHASAWDDFVDAAGNLIDEGVDAAGNLVDEGVDAAGKGIEAAKRGINTAVEESVDAAERGVDAVKGTVPFSDVEEEKDTAETREQ